MLSPSVSILLQAKKKIHFWRRASKNGKELVIFFFSKKKPFLEISINRTCPSPAPPTNTKPCNRTRTPRPSPIPRLYSTGTMCACRPSPRRSRMASVFPTCAFCSPSWRQGMGPRICPPSPRSHPSGRSSSPSRSCSSLSASSRPEAARSPRRRPFLWRNPGGSTPPCQPSSFSRQVCASFASSLGGDLNTSLQAASSSRGSRWSPTCSACSPT